MINDDTISAVEAILFLSNEPLTLETISKTLGINREKSKNAISFLINQYETDKTKGIQIREIAGGFRFSTKPKVKKYIEEFYKYKNIAKVSKAA
ncbi:MAG TPA: SMC-Scp complex subunit ScpB, partial [Thermoanaerobacterales bacterium]|nr:SMC-Scp complex subunit ScpB [Thermoanaerobacterales bacterium]